MATAVYPSMSPAVFDTDQVLLTKLAYWLQAAAEAVGGSNSTMLLPSMAAGPYDLPQTLLVKAAYWAEQIAAGGGGGGGGLAFSTGSGSPEGSKVGSPGDTYWDNDTDNYYVKVTGTATNTGWAIH